jgi:hypothetical protein
MLTEIKKAIIEFRIGLLHAKYHRHMKKATLASVDKDLASFKRHIYSAEDSWRKIVILINSKSYKGEDTNG